jgi:hypothetical protein
MSTLGLTSDLCPADHTIRPAFVFPVFKENQKHTIQNLDFFGKFRIRAVFPMHGQAGNTRYLDFQKAMQARFSGLPVHVPMAMEQKFIYEKGSIVSYIPSGSTK